MLKQAILCAVVAASSVLGCALPPDAATRAQAEAQENPVVGTGTADPMNGAGTAGRALGLLPMLPKAGEEPVEAPEPTTRVLYNGFVKPEVLGFSEDGSRAVYALQEDGVKTYSVFVADMATGETRFVDKQVVVTIKNDPVKTNRDGSAVLYRTDPDGMYDWHQQGDLHLWRWDTMTSQVVDDSVVRACYRFSPDGGRVVYARGQGRDLFVRSVETADDVELDSNVWAHANTRAESVLPMSDDGRWLAYNRGGYAGPAFAVDLKTNQTVLLADVVVAQSLAFQDGWLSWNGGVSGQEERGFYNLASAARMTSGQGGQWVTGRDNAILYRRGTNMELLLWSVADGQERSLAESVSRFRFSPSGRFVVYLRQNGSLHVFDRQTELYQIVGTDVVDHMYSFDAMVFGPEEMRLAYFAGPCGTPGSLRVVELESGKSVAPPAGGICGANFFAPDGSSIVYLSDYYGRYDVLEQPLDGDAMVVLAEDVAPTFLMSPDGQKTAWLTQGDGGLCVRHWGHGLEATLGLQAEGTVLDAVSDEFVLYHRTLGDTFSVNTIPLPEHASAE